MLRSSLRRLITIALVMQIVLTFAGKPMTLSLTTVRAEAAVAP